MRCPWQGTRGPDSTDKLVRAACPMPCHRPAREQPGPDLLLLLLLLPPPVLAPGTPDLNRTSTAIFGWFCSPACSPRFVSSCLS
ncbi:hypothetical protein BO71DRAFT_214810 [Aspergillus ellipticus CBS 707.79]|uniref:Uncharacterized protein n=1 Tax=Aspergillus ellipticus CBS 707.79 TaxID=1448320 RepID=A0A319DC78_9EURO|nr:hypothetical protein BO71DRAFT_214810 [Aspergillus ellipticus CBS 707.79]